MRTKADLLRAETERSGRKHLFPPSSMSAIVLDMVEDTCSHFLHGDNLGQADRDTDRMAPPRTILGVVNEAGAVLEARLGKS